ncbi:MAG: late competence development ComFB family protein [Anaerovoracaceae bacterium]
MPKKSNKTAHVLSLLTNGRDIPDEDTSVQKKTVARAKKKPDQEPVPEDKPSQVTQMAQIANLEAQVITPDIVQGLHTMFQAAPAVMQSPAPPKPEVVVEVQNSDTNSLLSDMVKADLERELDEQIKARVAAASKAKEHDDPERPPYSATFLAKFGDSLKKIEELHHQDEEQKKHEENSTIQDAEISEEDCSDASGLTAEPEIPDLTEPVPEQITAEISVSAPPEQGVDNKDCLPSSLDEVTTEPYVLENFDEEEGLAEKENKIEGEQGKNMGKEYSVKNNPTLSDNTSDDNKLVIRNLAEELVKTKAVEIMESMNMCTCRECFCDVVTYTLNHLPPLYMATKKGQLFQKLAACENQYGADIASEITKACITIKLNPRHEASGK